MPQAFIDNVRKLIDAELSRARAEARGVAVRTVAAVAAALLALGAATFLAVGGYLALLPQHGPFAAAAVVAGCLAVAAILVLAVGVLVAQSGTARRHRARRQLAHAALEGDVVRTVSDLRAAGVSPALLGLGALLAGVVAGASASDDEG